MEAQRERARAGSHFEMTRAQGFTVTGAGTQATLDALGDRFDGYDITELTDAKVVALFDADRTDVPALESGATGFVVLDRTPFYVESGGQVSDTGTLATEDASADGPGDVAPRGRWPARASRHGVARHAACGRARHGARRPRTAQCDPPQPYRHPPAARRAAPDARHARQAGRVACRARSAALRLRAHRRRSPPATSRPSSASSTRGSCATRRCRPTLRRTDEAMALGRDGAVRREVRRHGARGGHPRLQPRTVRRHALSRHRRHRPASPS